MWVFVIIAMLCAVSYCCFQLGRRWERGRQEIREEQALAKYEKLGTVRLNTVRIRR